MFDAKVGNLIQFTKKST